VTPKRGKNVDYFPSVEIGAKVPLPAHPLTNLLVLVGIVSHVPELRERIDVRLEVVTGRSGSTARFVQ
jgi:hypothetical protein